ncbi:unnamed protein product [Periconia digitata]|uniref:Thioesterase domain-containing protein n=1 Tax=Periconia digitata TaxID=1303443 RepID=A0A9W4UJH9_9PLEO|nr:unnamed protein product [Periconia digitata]
MSSRIKHAAAALSAASDVNLTALEKVKKWYEIAVDKDYDGHDAILFSSMVLESASFEPTHASPHNGKTVYSLVVPRTLCNLGGNLHGGAVALIFDISTSLAITAVSKPGFWDSGNVSRNLNCTYLRPVAEGQKIWIESEVVHLGRRMGLTRALIRTEDGKVCYTCEHSKATLGDPSL